MKQTVFTKTKQMKTNLSKKIVLGALVLSSTMTYAQKSNTTNAAMAYKSYRSSRMSGDFEQAAKDMLEAKGYIDKSIAHPDTKTDPKTLLYKGKIYLELIPVGMMAKNETIEALDQEETAKAGVEALKSVEKFDKKGRYEDDVDQYCYQYRNQGNQLGIKMFQEGKYKEAMGAFVMSTTFAEIQGDVDSASYFNAGLAAFNVEEWEVVEESFEKCVEIGYKTGSSVAYLTEAYSKLEKTAEAETMLKEQVIKNPGNKDIMISLINIYLGQDKKEEAEKVLTDAIALDPDNKDLHYAVATVYENLERYKDAEVAYKRVLEYDPNYTDALLGLGAVYFNQAADLNGKINDLMPGDPNEDKYRAEMTEHFKNSLPYLEKADELSPNNKEILNSLKQVYYKLEMLDKFKATKAKIDKL